MNMVKQQIRIVSTPGKLDNINISLEWKPGKFLGKLLLEQGISYDSVYQAVKHHLKFYPHCLQSVQELRLLLQENGCIFVFGFAYLFATIFKSLMMFISQMKLGSTLMAM